MSTSFDNSSKMPESSGPNRTTFKPQTRLGRWAIGTTLVAMASWVVLPLITITFRDTFPITDTWVMPAILTILTDAAAVLSVLAIWRAHERSILNLAAVCISVPAALFATLMVVSEGLAGV